MLCTSCDGSGWSRRRIPHPYAPGHTVQVVKPCLACDGTGLAQMQLTFDMSPNAAKENNSQSNVENT